MAPDPLQIRDRLAQLFETADARPGVAAEISRARRDFFGAEQPDYLVDETALDAAAQRFAEWFLLERESDVLGAVPVTVLDVEESDELRASRHGLFLVEGRADEGAWVRDLDGGERVRTVGIEQPLAPGDLLVGRLFGEAGDAHTPSFGATLVGGAAQLAVAFQRDLRAQELGRRLDQAEVEHLVHRRLGMGAIRAAGGDPSTALPGPDIRDDVRPVEHLEAELQALFDAAGDVPEPFTATTVSTTLRAHHGEAGGVIAPLLDKLAFDSTVDLDRLRPLLLELWSAHRAAPASDTLPGTLPSPGTRHESVKPPATTPKPSVVRPKFQPEPGEHLGETLARRIEQGLASDEAVGDLFADVERLFGEEIGDEEDDGERQVGPDLGDIDAWTREFAWEVELDTVDVDRLNKLAEHLREAPVPRLEVESIEAEDLLRFFLRAWLETPPSTRVAELSAQHALVERFLAWVADSQSVDVRDRLEPAKERLIAAIPRCDAASSALSEAAEPPASVAEREAGRLLRVEDIGDSGALHVVEPGSGLEVQLTVAPDAAPHLQLGDLMITSLRELRDGRARPGEYVVVLPGGVESLVSG